MIDPFFRFNEEHFTFHPQYKHSGTFANRKYEELSYPKKSENARPHSSQSSHENATPSSYISPLACYKEVPPTPQDLIPDQKGQNLYPFSDQKGAKTVPVRAAHTYMAYIREYPHHPFPPTPTPGRHHRGRLSILFVHWNADNHTPSYA